MRLSDVLPFTTAARFLTTPLSHHHLRLPIPPLPLPLRTGLGKLDFSVQVLTTGHWPFYKPFDTMNLPPIMQRAVQVGVGLTKAFKTLCACALPCCPRRTVFGGVII
jgi:hypothetical protein